MKFQTSILILFVLISTFHTIRVVEADCNNAFDCTIVCDIIKGKCVFPLDGSPVTPDTPCSLLDNPCLSLLGNCDLTSGECFAED
ncbi:hypothetical protein PPL_05887 [Heterostelium album PN500]|uniref:Uncharacterized protein n=1 Tax=Heterostelium pallidum (strain ATCC 26659 / Pp 5 / PN500) TaxID=670386 RepID=D3BBL8_HETP5|nr:hypothetical protein PPL_05887 [Heterostelium album PN500]EFA81051.1 hypothetical protein PPL_05887 [Heterostelium album PN500]|eukprot:XP_020433169.1 hypothetical protein PPL_05887 [Heterostelium album PN500]